MKNKFIAIEGLDGSGKSTQIDLLIKYFEEIGTKTKFVHFPRHGEGIFGELISKFLRGEFGNIEQVHPQLVALIFAEDRKDYSNTIFNWLQEGCTVLVDRYVLSNIAFQCAKLKSYEEKLALTKWINMFEYEYNKIPKPDVSIYLDVPFSFTENSLYKRSISKNRKYLHGQNDIHEADLNFQNAVKIEYETLLITDNSIKHIICFDNNNKMKSVEDVFKDILCTLIS